MLEPIQSLWIGDSLSKIEQLCIKSFIDNGHPFILYTYSAIDNIPEGAIIEDGNKILPAGAIFTHKEGWGKGSYAGFADLFRFTLLKQKGGWWVDTDVVCLKPFNFTADLIICSSFEGQWGSCANNCILKIPRDHYFVNYILDEIYKIDFENATFGVIGPGVVQKAVSALKLESYVVPYCYFNPISWSNVGPIILNKLSSINKIKELLRPVLKPKTLPGRRINANSYAVHFWNEVWRQNNFDKNSRYSKFSLFEKLKSKHGIK